LLSAGSSSGVPMKPVRKWSSVSASLATNFSPTFPSNAGSETRSMPSAIA
jgi:hypothetical protein